MYIYMKYITYVLRLGLGGLVQVGGHDEVAGEHHLDARGLGLLEELLRCAEQVLLHQRLADVVALCVCDR